MAIVVLPLVAATLAFQLLSGSRAESQTNSRLRLAAATAGALWRGRLRLVEVEVARAADRLSENLDSGSLGRRVKRARGSLDFLFVTDEEGVLTASTASPLIRPGIPGPTPEQIADGATSTGTLRSQVQIVAGGRSFVVAGGQWADRELAVELSEATGVDVALVRSGTMTAATGPLPGGPPAGGELPGNRRALLVSADVPGDGILLVAQTESVPTDMWIVAVLGLAVATLLGFALAGVLARPLERLAEGARAVAGGDLSTRVEAGEISDVARVAESFNAMTDHLRAYVGELESSRDELRRSLDRMGATLRTTLDMEGMLEVILDTAAVMLGATAGALYLRRPVGRELALEVARGYTPTRGARLMLEHGVAGRAAAGIPVLVPRDDVESAGPVEPQAPTAVAVPLVRGDRAIGVIALYGRTTPDPFDERDVETLTAFAGQASVAIENVLLHEETEQLSITDGLTGVWNRRYLELSLSKEIERASRFNRPLSVLMIDIDRFKDVNDRYGHQRGDGVLVEVSRRVMGTIRTQIDFVARYGGEEFVVVLPETPGEGAKVVAEKIRSAVREHPFVGEGPHLGVTVSVGVAAFPLDGLTTEDLIRASDQAMYRAKRAGRDRVEARLD